MTLDYKYIEQLLEGYFNGETTIEEEKILRTFFCQQELPESLVQYRELFVYEQTEPKEDCLGADFDAKIMGIIGSQAEHKIVHLKKRNAALQIADSTLNALRPFFKAAAIVAVIVTIGNASQALFTDAAVEETSVAKIQTTTGKNVADMQKSDSLKTDTLSIMND